MKNFKIGLATVAVAAMSFTFASKDGILGKVRVPDGCDTLVTIEQIPPNPPITYGRTQSPINPESGNPKPHSSTIDVPNRNSPVIGVSGSIPNYITTGCTAPYNNFCCFEVINNTVNKIYYRS